MDEFRLRNFMNCQVHLQTKIFLFIHNASTTTPLSTASTTTPSSTTPCSNRVDTRCLPYHGRQTTRRRLANIPKLSAKMACDGL